MNKPIQLKSLLLALLILALSASGCGQPAVAQNSSSPQGTITVSGAFALYPIMVTWADEYQKIHPGVRIDVSAGGAGKGMADTLGGAVDIGMVSRDISPDEEAKGAYWVAVTKDAVFPTVSAQNPALESLMALGISQQTFSRLYISGEITTWGQVIADPQLTDEVHVYTRSDACGAADVWAKYLGKQQEDLLGIGVFGDPGILDAVIKDPLGLGYNNLNYAFDMSSGKPVAGAVVVPVDFNGNGKADPEEVMDTKAKALAAVASGRYPSPPARVLNLVTKGKPGSITQDFLEWILTDGQQYVDATGYIQLEAGQLAAELAKVR
jgi:phosphate transport system substrate-binding protein